MAVVKREEKLVEASAVEGATEGARADVLGSSGAAAVRTIVGEPNFTGMSIFNMNLLEFLLPFMSVNFTPTCTQQAVIGEGLRGFKCNRERSTDRRTT